MLSFGAFKELGSFWAISSHAPGIFLFHPSQHLLQIFAPSSKFHFPVFLLLINNDIIFYTTEYIYSPSPPILKILFTFQFKCYPTPPKMLSHIIPIKIFSVCSNNLYLNLLYLSHCVNYLFKFVSSARLGLPSYIIVGMFK